MTQETLTRAGGRNRVQQEKLLSRLRRIEGQAGALVRMAEREAYCVDMLTQLAAVRAALLAAGKIILKDHLHSCVCKSLQGGDARKAITEIETVLSQFVK